MCYNYICLSRGDIMPKIKIKASLENKNEKNVSTCESMGIKIDNKIKYSENDICTVIKILKPKLVLERKCAEYHIVLNFDLEKETKGIYNIFNLGSLELKIKTKSLSIADGKIKIDYELENMGEITSFSYLMEMEEVK